MSGHLRRLTSQADFFCLIPTNSLSANGVTFSIPFRSSYPLPLGSSSPTGSDGSTSVTLKEFGTMRGCHADGISLILAE